ncbi:A/G-specific adenine glycosylase [Candidatus Roizmanbacteria bacterium]|nr:A/G-specific adenine glycosylase [Candidatus Roizmanbacteria bacterium]
MNSSAFRTFISSFYKKNKRDLPWRPPSLKLRRDKMVDDPYKILVSEVMLQQTQVSRVMAKYREFIDRFPSFESLARAHLIEVLKVWQGMGYNRRGKYLKEAAERVVKDKRYSLLLQKNRSSSARTALFSDSAAQVALLQELPGIGYNTACAILTYSFNIPTVFIETNIRTVYLFHFFHDKQNVSDKDILEVLNSTIDMENPREWYYALMDYGAYLKRERKFKNISSKHYTKQSKFEGSRRQLRGRILKTLLTYGPSSLTTLKEQLPDDERLESVLKELTVEKMVYYNKSNRTYTIV